MAPWDGAWSFSSQWNSRKYIVEIPCGTTNNSDCAYIKQLNSDFSIPGIAGLEESSGYETANGYCLEYDNYVNSVSGPRKIGRWNLNEDGETISFVETIIMNPSGSSKGALSRLGDYVFYQKISNDLPTLMKVDFSGNLIWSKEYTLNPSFNSSSISYRSSFEDSDGILSAGLITNSTDGSRNPYLIKTDLDGNEIWQSFLPAEDKLFHINIRNRSEDDGYYISMAIDQSTPTAPLDFIRKIYKIDNLGNVEWVHNTTPPALIDNLSDQFLVVGKSSEGLGLFYADEINNAKDIAIVKLNSSTGEVLWEQELVDAFLPDFFIQTVNVQGATTTSDGGIMALFNFYGSSPDSTDNYWGHHYGKLDANGNVVWNYDLPQDFNFGFNQSINPQLGLSDGGIIMNAQVNSQNIDSLIAIRITSEGLFNPICQGVTPSEIVINCPTDLEFITDPNTNQAVINFADATGTTTCPDGVLSILNMSILTSGTSVGVGEYTITYEATDACGNISTCSFDITVVEGNVGGGCPPDISGFTTLGEYNGSKYFISDGTSQPAAAQLVAQQNGGYLAVINDQSENDFIQQNISEMAYIGLNDVQNEGILEWENGDPLNYNNINPCGFCNSNSNDFDYVIMQPWDGNWSFSSQWNSRKYIVEISCDTIPVVQPTVCPDTLPKFYQNYGNIVIGKVTQLSNCNFISLSTDKSNNSQRFVLTTDVEGNELERVELGTISYRDFSISDDGNWMLIHNTFDSLNQINITHLTKMDPAGNIFWTSSYLDFISARVEVTTEGNVVIAGSVQYNSGSGNGNGDPKVILLDGVGSIIWEKLIDEFSTNYPLYAGVRDIIQTADGGFIIGGVANIHKLIKLDGDGNILWENDYSNGFPAYLNNIAELPSGEIVFTGEITQFVNSWPGFRNIGIITKVDSIGNEIWTEKIGLTQFNTDQRGSGIAVNSQGKIAVTGKFCTEFTFNQNVNLPNGAMSCSEITSVAIFDTNGNGTLIPDLDSHQGGTVTITVDDGFVFAGRIGINNSYLMKTDLQGNFLQNPTTSSNLVGWESPQLEVVQKVESIDEISFTKVFPNPTSHDISIEILSPIQQEVEVQLFDARGLLQKIFQIDLTQGGNTKLLSTGDLANGFYSIFIPRKNGKHLAKRFVKIGN